LSEEESVRGGEKTLASPVSGLVILLAKPKFHLHILASGYQHPWSVMHVTDVHYLKPVLKSGDGKNSL
jgi:hypothetical protein